ncbi:MAG: hypothetical protein A2V77_23585 [Anaeromyxobacter sp. RBG_16_69_14]|nr:MAG: hypothetical protein A2V77_23585 [Anaeromyxobacter sp. RBG_16_69_14]
MSPFVIAPFRRSERPPIAVWFTEPAGFVTGGARLARSDRRRGPGSGRGAWFSQEHVLDEHGARFIMDAFDAGSSIVDPSRRERFVFIHEWSRMASYTSAARSTLMRWGIGLRAQVMSIDFVLAKDASSIVRMGVAVVNATFSTFGLPVRAHFGTEAAAVIESLGLRARPLGEATR